MLKNNVASADLVILLFIAGVVITLLLTMALSQQVQKRAGHPTRRQRPSRAPVDLPFSASERQILNRLGWLLRTSQDRHRILTDHSFFVQVARMALREGLVTEQELRSLARRLGFRVDRFGIPGLSTLKIPSGVEISVADVAMNSGAGTIVTNHPDALRIKLKMGQTSFPPGTRLDVVCKSPTGLYRFSSVVAGIRGRTLDLLHTSEIEQIQRRVHRRHGIQMPVDLAGPDGRALPARTTDLSIGGAAMVNPGRTFPPGTTLNVTIGRNGRTVSVPATVVRSSRRGKVIHLQFHRPEELTQQRLFKLILDASRSKPA